MILWQNTRIQERLWRSCHGVVGCTPRAEPPHSSNDHACDPPEALSGKKIGLPPRQNCRNPPPIKAGVSSFFKIIFLYRIKKCLYVLKG